MKNILMKADFVKGKTPSILETIYEKNPVFKPVLGLS